MTTFKEIRGTAVESVSSDPSNPESGQFGIIILLEF
jgi:hypothetical protein